MQNSDKKSMNSKSQLIIERIHRNYNIWKFLDTFRENSKQTFNGFQSKIVYRWSLIWDIPEFPIRYTSEIIEETEVLFPKISSTVLEYLEVVSTRISGLVVKGYFKSISGKQASSNLMHTSSFALLIRLNPYTKSIIFRPYCLIDLSINHA